MVAFQETTLYYREAFLADLLGLFAVKRSQPVMIWVEIFLKWFFMSNAP